MIDFDRSSGSITLERNRSITLERREAILAIPTLEKEGNGQSFSLKQFYQRLSEKEIIDPLR